MQTELHSAQAQLEAEKSRFKKMQTDLQKELMGAFDENTKLTTLLDGKVPKSENPLSPALFKYYGLVPFHLP